VTPFGSIHHIERAAPKMTEPTFKVDFEQPTKQIMLEAKYPAGCNHRTSMDAATAEDLVHQLMQAVHRLRS
jgi:hypothetical protein